MGRRTAFSEGKQEPARAVSRLVFAHPPWQHDFDEGFWR
jgi:hypothetical protein